MPTETRYMRSDQQTVNGVTAYKLGTSESATLVELWIATSQRVYVGIRVSVVHADGSETRLDTQPSATVPYAAGTAQTTTLSAGYSILNDVALSPTDAIKVEVYADTSSPPQSLLVTFITSQLGASKLNAANWTVYYRLRRTAKVGTTSYFYFRFGIAGDDSYITNFAWTTAGVAYVKEVSDSCVAVEVLGKGVLMAKLDSVFGVDVSAKGLVTCVSDSGVAVDFSANDFLKSLADVGLVGDWKSFALLSCVLDVLKGLDWIPFGVPHVVELRDVFGVYELFNLPPLIADLNRVLDKVDVYVKVGVQTWLYLWDKVFITDYTYPWDVGKVKELLVVIGWVSRDYPLTDWELKRNERIASYLSEHKVFRLSDFQRSVWFEQMRMQEQRAFGSFSKQMFYYRSRYIENFCNFLFMVLEEKGMVRKAGLDSYLVVETPSVELINEISRRRWFDIWSFC